MTLRVVATLRDLGCRVEPCGSQVTCNPAPDKGSDVDYLVQIPDAPCFAEVIDFLHHENYWYEGEDAYDIPPDGETFASWRHDTYPEAPVNMLLTTSAEWAEKHRVATDLCTRLNLLSKPDRLAVFQAVLYTKVYIDRFHMGMGIDSPSATEQRLKRSAALARQGE